MSNSGDHSASVKESLLAGNQLQRYVRSHSRNADEADEVYQEAIVRVLERARHDRILNPVAYAIRVARNLMISAGKNKVETDDELDFVSSTKFCPERTLSAQQKLAITERALAQMPPLRKKVFVMRRLHGQSREEISKALSLNVESVSKHITRAMADIQHYIDKHS